MFSDWVSFLAHPNLFGIKGFVVVDTRTKKSRNDQLYTCTESSPTIQRTLLAQKI
jgi:hypothetical protein